MSSSFDSIWEDIYSKGNHLNLYPFDAVVSFLFNKQLRNIPRSQQNVIEVGCGAGNNLWFAAREGFNVSGIDASTSAINFAKHRFKQEKLLGNFDVGNFIELPYESCFSILQLIDALLHIPTDRVYTKRWMKFTEY
nr:class I SAM-dependent methyltransferase [Ningiella sp. W23]